ncbi:MAG: hypothetical protein II034_01150, partial [Muribaculaceae bacterium]|nr:hypothetical protein [Muribaculaceae bacterium]
MKELISIITIVLCFCTARAQVITSIGEQNLKIPKTEKKEENNLQNIMEIVNRGVDYWQSLVKIAQDHRIKPSFQELTA